MSPTDDPWMSIEVSIVETYETVIPTVIRASAWETMTDEQRDTYATELTHDVLPRIVKTHWVAVEDTEET